MKKEKAEKVERKYEMASPGAPNIFDLVEDYDDEAKADQAKSDAEIGGKGANNYGRLTGNDSLRLCPPKKGAIRKVLYRETYRHFVSDRGDGKFAIFGCVKKLRPPGRCYVCEALDAAEAACEDESDKQDIKKQQPKWGAYWNAINMAKKEEGAKIYWFPTTLHKAVKKLFVEEDEDVDNDIKPWDIREGYPIKVMREEGETSYQVKALTKKSEQLDPEFYVGMGDLEAEAQPPTPRELFRIAKALAKQYGVLKEMDWDDVEFDTEDEKPTKGKKAAEKPATKKAKSKPRDEDEDDEYEPVGRVKDEDDEDDDDDEAETPKSKAKAKEIIIEAPKKAKKKRQEIEEDWD